MPSQLELLSFDSVSTSERRAIFWGFLWRQLLICLAAIVAGNIVSLLVGFFIWAFGRALGYDESAISLASKIASVLLSVPIALLLYWQLLAWLFHSTFGPFRLCLVRAELLDASSMRPNSTAESDARKSGARGSP